MAYRDQPVDLKVAELEERIASEPAVRSKLVPIRLEHDELQGQLAVVGAQLSEAEADLAKRRWGGVRATVSGWIGRALEELETEVARLASSYGKLLARAAELDAAEVALLAEIRGVEEARQEIAALRDRTVDALRVAEGPIGDEVRALDADDVLDRDQRASIVAVLDVVEFARTAVWQVQTVADDLKQLTGAGSTVSVVFELIEAPFNTPATHAQRDECRVRLSDSFETAMVRLVDVIATYDRTGCRWFAAMSRERVHEIAVNRRARVEETWLARDAEAVIGCMLELIRGLSEVRDRLARNLIERDTRRRELARVT